MKRYLWLGLIVIFAGFLRIWNLSNLPPGFTPDEAAFGYNAYSLLKTGRDEWGVPFYKLPLTNLESFGDYKLPLYAFLTVPSVKLFGLNQFATRLPNAIFGTLAVLVIYVLAKKIWPKSAIYAALLLSISPWGVQLSRGAFEANLVTLLLPLTIILFFQKQYLFSSLILVLNFYSYHSARFISLILLIIYCLKIKNFKLKIISIILFLSGLIALFGSGGSRTSDVSIISPTDSWKSVSDRRFEANQIGLPDDISRLFSNKVIYIATLFTKNYLSYLSLDFLFLNGPKESTYGMLPGTGVLYLFEIITITIALIYLIKHPNKNILYLLIIFFISIIPAALSKGPGFAANRAVPELLFLILVSALGLSIISKYIPKLLLILFYSLSLLPFLESYLFHHRDLDHGMLYGRKEMVNRITKLSSAYPNIQISRSLSEPHIYFAFYNQIDPMFYQSQSKSWQKYHDAKLKFLDQYDGYYLGNLRFGALKLDQKNTLFAGLPQDFRSETTPMFQIDYPDGSPAIFVTRQ